MTNDMDLPALNKSFNNENDSHRSFFQKLQEYELKGKHGGQSTRNINTELVNFLKDNKNSSQIIKTDETPMMVSGQIQIQINEEEKKPEKDFSQFLKTINSDILNSEMKNQASKNSLWFQNHQSEARRINTQLETINLRFKKDPLHELNSVMSSSFMEEPIQHTHQESITANKILFSNSIRVPRLHNNT